MPLTPDAPVTANVYVRAPKTIDRLYLREIKLMLIPGAPAKSTMQVTWATGYREDGEFMPVSEHVADLSGPSLIQVMQQDVTPGKSHYNDLRATVWDLLQAGGYVPVGTAT